MTPVISLILVSALVSVLTWRKWQFRHDFADFSQNECWKTIGWHVCMCMAAADLVWLLNWSIWSSWPDCLPILGLLCLEGLLLGAVSSVMLYGVAWLHIPDLLVYFQTMFVVQSPKAKIPMPSATMPKAPVSNVVPMQRGKLPAGRKIIWDDVRGGWYSYDDERNALAG